MKKITIELEDYILTISDNYRYFYTVDLLNEDIIVEDMWVEDLKTIELVELQENLYLELDSPEDQLLISKIIEFIAKVLKVRC